MHFAAVQAGHHGPAEAHSNPKHPRAQNRCLEKRPPQQRENLSPVRIAAAATLWSDALVPLALPTAPSPSAGSRPRADESHAAAPCRWKIKRAVPGRFAASELRIRPQVNGDQSETVGHKDETEGLSIKPTAANSLATRVRDAPSGMLKIVAS